MTSEPEIRSTAVAELTVGEADLASAVGLEKGDDFPRVFATARLVALMEIAAARLLRPHLREGESSVGVSVDILHTAATPLHGTVVATATYMGRDGKLFVFEVLAADDAGEVGRGTHKRAIVSSDRLTAGAAKRLKA
ncbi:MAG TPA: thioesterase [Thermoanaerobaculia bacterium]